MTLLAIFSAAFLITHFGLSSSPLRATLANSMGEGPYLGIYSIISFVTLGGMIYTYSDLLHLDYIWLASKPLYIVSKVLMLLAFPLMFAGLMGKNPTAVQQERALEGMTERATGIFTITRHPVQWAFLLWAIAHIVSNGDVASLVFFGTLALTAGFGTLMIDLKKSRQEGGGWKTFYATTSNIPFVAILQGRNSLQLTSTNWIAIVISLVVYTVIYYFHASLFGVGLY